MADIPEDIKLMDIAALNAELEAGRTRYYDAMVRRNYIQNEKDQIKQFYEITKQKVDLIDSKLRNKDTEMEMLEDNHRVELKVYNQKIKHLEYDHKNAVEKVDIEGTSNGKEERNEHVYTENTAKKNKIDLRVTISERELANIDAVKDLSANHDRNLKKMKDEYDKVLMELQGKYEEKLKRLKADLELRLKVEIHEIEERKNKHRNELMQNHEKAFRDLKSYYNNITRSNLELIRSQEEEKKQLEQRAEENEKTKEILEDENRRIKAPLEAAESELEMLKTKLANYKYHKISLINAKQRLITLRSKLDECRSQKDEMEAKYNRALSEKSELESKFEFVSKRVMDKADYKNVFLERKLMALDEKLQQKEEQLQRVLRTNIIDTRFVVDISKRIEDSMDAKNTIIKNLKYTIAHATKAYNDAIRVYEAKLVEFGIPAEELGFQPMESETSTMPAGLVAA